MPPLRFRRTGDVQLDQFQRELDAATRVVLGSPFATGHAIRGLALSASPLAVAHGLPAPLLNWIVLRLVATAASEVFEVAQGVALYTSQITLQATGACVVDLWVS